MSHRILNRNIVPIIIIGMMFFVFGFATWINAMLIPYFKIACELPHFQSYLVTFAFYISYLVVSVPSLTTPGFRLKTRFGFRSFPRTGWDKRFIPLCKYSKNYWRLVVFYF